MFHRKTPKKTYDREHFLPVLRCSICTGERVAGFKDLRTGKFQDIALVRTDEDLRRLKEEYGVDAFVKEY